MSNDQLAHLRSSRRRRFVEEFVETGNATESARSAGYFLGDEVKLRTSAMNLKYQLRSEISSLMRERLKGTGPKALAKIEYLMDTSESEVVQLNAAKELIDRSRIWEGDQWIQKSTEQLEAELVTLVGADGAKLMLARIRTRRNNTGPSLEAA